MIELTQGDNAAIKVNVTQDGAPMDLSQYAGKLSIQHNLNDAAPLVVLDQDAASDLVNGQLVFNISTTQSQEIEPGAHLFAVIIYKDQERQTVTDGQFIVNKSLKFEST